MHLNEGSTPMDKYIEITAQKSRMYLLPDSSKVWMQPGSSIRFAEDFEKHRNVWLKGNSLFEVHKNMGRKFRVYIDKSLYRSERDLLFDKSRTIPVPMKLLC